MAGRSKEKHNLGYGLFIAAAIFLVNPVINIIDILPDFLGYHFLICAISKWADLNYKMKEATRALSNLRLVCLIKIPAILLLSLDEGMPTLLTFVFLIIELLLLIPAVGQIFEGMGYFATRFDSDVPLRSQKILRPVTYLFFIGKAALTLLPELCSLSSFEYSGYVTSGPQVDLADFKNLFTLINIFFTILLGILWLVNFIPYINRIAAEKPFIHKILAAYNEEIAGNRNILVRRSMRSAVSMLTAAVVFIPNFALDNINIMPNFLVSAFILAAIIYMKRLSVNIKALLPIALISTVVSTASYALTFSFELIHGIDIVRYRPDAFDATSFYNATRILSGIEYAILCVLIILTIKELILLTSRLFTSEKESDERILLSEKELQREMKRSLTGGGVFLTTTLGANLAYILARAPLPDDLWLVPFIISVSGVVFFAAVLRGIKERIEKRYI